MRRLWKLSETTKPVDDFYVFDTETGFWQTIKKALKKLRIINWCLDGDFQFGAVYGKDYECVVFSKQEFHNLFKTERFRGKKVFAHNGSFDLDVLYDSIFELDNKAIFIGSRFICATNGVCTFADSSNIFVGRSVKELGKMLKLEKLTLGDSENKSNGITKDVIIYCVRDCEVVYEALLKVFEFIGSIKITQAAASLTYFRRFKQPFHIDFNEYTAFFWDSYYGGRTEAFKLGHTHAKVIDCNSMYPYAMRECEFPNPKFLKVEDNLSVNLFLKYLQWYEGCFYGEVYHKKTWIGFLPVKQDGKLVFATGRLVGCWNFNEIRFALENNVIEIKRVDRVVYSEKMKSIFIDFVNDLNNIKLLAELEGNEFERDRAKRLANSLYGKFGQRIDEETIYIKDYVKEWNLIQDYERKGLYKNLITFNSNRRDAFLVIKSSKDIHLSNSIPSFSSYTTSFARVELLKKMLAMQHNKIVYCDTDSVFFEIDDGTIVSDQNLGGWKIEDKIVTEIRGLKNYKFVKDEKEIWRVKGVPVNKGRFTKIVQGDDEMNVPTVEQIGPNKFRYYNIIKDKEALKRGKKTREITERIKEIKHAYDKRVVFANGETEPIHIL